MKIHNFEQLSDDWFDIRKGKMTASHAQAIATAGGGLDTYLKNMMAEFYSSGIKEHFSNKDTDRGNELEPQARILYELETGIDVDEVGFIEFDKYTGISPDGLVKKNGGVEIKCLNDNNHFNMTIEGIKSIESKYMWQIQMSLYLTKRDWWDYVGYNPNFEKSLLIYRILPDLEKFKKLENGIKIGKARIKEIKELYSNIKI